MNNLPYFNFISYAALHDAQRDEKGNLVYRQRQSGSMLFPLLLTGMTVMMVVSSAVHAQTFTVFDALMMAVPLVFGSLLAYTSLRRSVTIVFSDAGITLSGKLRRRKSMLWDEITDVSSFAPIDGGERPQQSMLIYFRDSRSTVFALPLLMQGFADFFNMASSKLSGSSFDDELNKVVAYFRRARIDIVNKRVINEDPFRTDSPFEGF